MISLRTALPLILAAHLPSTLLRATCPVYALLPPIHLSHAGTLSRRYPAGCAPGGLCLSAHRLPPLPLRTFSNTVLAMGASRTPPHSPPRPACPTPLPTALAAPGPLPTSPLPHTTHTQHLHPPPPHHNPYNPHIAVLCIAVLVLYVVDALWLWRVGVRWAVVPSIVWYAVSR